MRVRAAVLALVGLAAVGCGSSKHSVPASDSLRELTRLTAERNDFGVILDAKSGKALAAFRVNNPVRAAVSDGDGGWYIGGGFIRVDGVLRKRLAHVRSDGTLDPDWKPEANGNGVSVTALARLGSRLFVGGDFASLNKQPRVHLGAVDTVSGKLLSWHPFARAPTSYPVLLAARDRIILGGYSGYPGASGLVALDPVSGRRVSSWRGVVDTSNLEGGSVRILTTLGHRLYFGGMFSSVNRVPTPGVAAVDVATGALSRRWRPPVQSQFCIACTDVTALAAGARRIYVGLPGALGALDPETGAFVDRWKPRLSLTAGIYCCAQASSITPAGDRLYVAGMFDRVRGKSHRGVAALDLSTGRPLPVWNPHANTAYGSLAVRSGDRVLVGIELSRAIQFDIVGLEAAKQPVERLNLRLALSGPGTVRIGLGRRCNYERWAETGRCYRRVSRWFGVVHFARAMRRRWSHALPDAPGRYFVRFVPRAAGGAPQPPYDFDFRRR